MTKQSNRFVGLRHATLAVVGPLLLSGWPGPTTADETCMSPYMAKIVGQEDYVYVWTLGVEGLGDEQDKLVTIDVNPQSPSYGKVINALSVGGRNEATTLASQTTGSISGQAASTQTGSLSSMSTRILLSRSCTRPSRTSSQRLAGWSARTRCTRFRGG